MYVAQVCGELQGSVWYVRLQWNLVQPRESKERRDLCHKEGHQVRIVTKIVTMSLEVEVSLKRQEFCHILPILWELGQNNFCGQPNVGIFLNIELLLLL